MTTCPKCGFKNDQTQAISCPKCGIIYEKFHKAKKNFSAEQELNAGLKRTLSQEDEIRSKSFLDMESHKDNDSYVGISYLSYFFIAFSCIIGIAWIIEIKFFWAFINSYQTLKGSEKLLALLSFSIFTFLPVAAFLSIGGALKLGKDIADNTRATRNYLAYLAKTKNR